MKRTGLGVLLLLMVLFAALGFLNKEKAAEKKDEPKTTINITTELDIADADDSNESEEENDFIIGSAQDTPTA